jgi:uncharacterized protein YdeI (BOF family)
MNQIMSVSVDISAAVGENISIAFTSNNNQRVNIDYVFGPEYYTVGYDMDLMSVNYNTLTKAGDISEYTVRIRSLSQDIVSGDDYTVSLYYVGNDEPLTTVQGVDLDYNMPVDFVVPYTHAPVGKTYIFAKINYNNDDVLDNNMSDTLPLTVVDADLVFDPMNEEATASQMPLPYSTKFYSVFEMLIPADSISETGEIKGLVFGRYSTPYTLYYETHTATVDVYIANTSDTNLAEGWIIPDSLVYSGAFDVDPYTQEMYINFDNSFAYNPDSNLVILFNVHNPDKEKMSLRAEYNTDKLALLDYSNDPFDLTEPIDGDSYNTDFKYFLNTTLLFKKSAFVTANVVDENSNVFAGVNVDLEANGTVIYSETTDENGKVAFTGIALDKTYSMVLNANGYEELVVDVTTNSDTVEMGTVVMKVINTPVDITVTVDNVEHTAVATWDGYTNSKDFVSYYVYLDDMTTPVATDVTEATYTFTDLADGMHVMGVASTYDGGMSPVVTDTFKVVYNPYDIDVKLYAGVTDARVTWSFDGTSDDFYGFIVSMNGVVVDTVSDKAYEFTGLADGTNAVAVSALYTTCGLSDAVSDTFVIVMAPTGLTVVENVKDTVAIAWVANNADSYNVYLNGEFVENVTDTSYTFTDVAAGYTHIGVSAVYGDQESEQATVDCTTGIEDVNSIELSVYPNPATNWIMVNASELSTVEIRNITGKLISTYQMTSLSERIDVSELENGIYIISVTNNSKVTSKRLIIE